MKKYVIYLIGILPLIYLIAIANTMPDQVVTHWNLNGTADRYGSKFTYLFLALLPMVILIFDYFYNRLNSPSNNTKYQTQIINGIVIFFSAIAFIFIKSSSSEQLMLANDLVVLFSFFFIYIGNILNKLEPNRNFGIRTPATLKSHKVWRRTHYIGGYLFVITGIISLISALVIENPMSALMIMIGLILCTTLSLLIYAQILYKRELQSKN